jgi:hypothetical protein
MSIRKLKHRAMSAMLANKGVGWFYDRLGKLTPEEVARAKALRDKMWEDIRSKMGLAELVESAPAVQKYTVARKKDGEIVGEFVSLTDAEEVIAKAKKAKRATLVLV